MITFKEMFKQYTVMRKRNSQILPKNELNELVDGTKIEDFTWPRGDTKFLFECKKLKGFV